MADNQSIDLMASIFGNISLPQVHASTDHLHRDEELDDQRSRTSSVPVPKQRQEHAYLPHEDYECPLLRKDSEFQSQVIPLEAVTVTYDRASRHSFGGSTFDELPERRQSSVIYDEIPYEHEHELHDQVHDVQSVHSHHTLNDRHSSIEEHSLHSEHSEVLPVDHIEPLHYEPEPELPPIDEDTARANRVIAELKERHFINDNFDGNTITTSKTSELANEYDLYSTPVPDAQPTDVNEQTDDSGTETEEVQPANRTQYLFDSQEPYHVLHDKAPDSFQRELGQRVSQYGERQESVEAPPRPAHAQKMESKRNSNASDFVVTTFDQPHHERIRSDISAADVNIHDLRHKFEHPHVHHQKSDSEHPSIRSNRSSYKQYVGRKPLAPSIRRSESIASTLTLGTENFSRDAYPSYRFAQHNAVSYEPPPVIHEQPQSPKPVMPAPKTYLKYVHPPKPVLQHQHSQDGQHVHHRPSIVHEPAPTHELSRQTSRRSSHHHAAPSVHEHVHEHVYEHVHEPVVHHEHHKKTVNSIQRNGLEYQAPKVNGNHAFLANERKSWAILEKYRHANEEHADENSNVHSVHHEEVHVPQEHHHVEHEVIHVHHNEHRSEQHAEHHFEHHEHHEEHSVHHHEEDHYSEIHDTHSDRDVTPTPPKEAERRTPIASLRNIFENDHHHHSKPKARPFSISQHSNGSHSRRGSEHVHADVPLVTRVVINDALANGRGKATPGSIAALHKSILEGNQNIGKRVVVHEVHEHHHEEEENEHATPPQHPHEIHRKPRTLANFYAKWGAPKVIA